jgi:2-dehydro-3-deoxyglucarate aldolase/4-hydroxy-2-oxoheptanedioate aldolase
MAPPVNSFKRALVEGRRLNGTWFMSASPVVAEALGHAGFDFLVLDMEHTTADVPQLFSLLQAVAGTPAASVVRLPWNDPVIVKRVLDAGAQSLMFPYIQSAEEAKAAVASTRYPPAGRRGVAAMHRAGQFGSATDYLKRAEEEICVILQLETPEAIGELPAIAGVEGVDCIFIGPGDLSASMGHIGDMAHPEVQKALEAAARACVKAGRPSGIVAPTPEMAKRFLDYGYSWSAVASDLGLLMGRASEILAAMRSA